MQTTCCIIGCFDPKKWAYLLNLSATTRMQLNSLERGNHYTNLMKHPPLFLMEWVSIAKVPQDKFSLLFFKQTLLSAMYLLMSTFIPFNSIFCEILLCVLRSPECPPNTRSWNLESKNGIKDEWWERMILPL